MPTYNVKRFQSLDELIFDLVRGIGVVVRQKRITKVGDGVLGLFQLVKVRQGEPLIVVEDSYFGCHVSVVNCVNLR